MKILVDSREPDWIASQIQAHPLLGELEITSLIAGDVWLDDIIIERKEPMDLLGSIADGRLFNQCCEMRLESDKCILLITGQLLAGYDNKIVGTGWHFNSVDAALFQVQEFGVTVCHCLNDLEFSNKLVWLLNRNWTQHVFLPPRKSGIPLETAERILDALPDVTPESATELIKKYQNPIQAINAILKGNELKPHQQKRVRESLGLNPDELLGVSKIG